MQAGPALRMSIGGSGSSVPFSLGMAVPGSDADASDCILVAWCVPGASAAATLRAGKKAKVIDIFGPSEPYDELKLETAAAASVPEVRVTRNDILLMNVELDADSQIPFAAFDALRTAHALDVSGVSLSMTHRGNLYRARV